MQPLKKIPGSAPGGKIALIQSTPVNLPVYYTFMFKMPMKVANSIKKIQRDVLRSGLGDERVVARNMALVGKSF